MASKMEEIVTPGTQIGEGDKKPGDNAYREDGKIYASAVGIVRERGDRVSVVAMAGAYVPKRGDLVVGEIAETRHTSWYVDIGTFTEGPLHVNEVPWDIDFGATEDYLRAGDSVLCEVTGIDEFGKPFLGMECRQCRKLESGYIVDVDPTKVARLIGRKGSMIKLLKRLSGCKMFVGQNGRVWVSGETHQMRAAEKAVQMIAREAHTKGLTERVEKLLKDELDKE